MACNLGEARSSLYPAPRGWIEEEGQDDGPVVRRFVRPSFFSRDPCLSPWSRGGCLRESESSAVGTGSVRSRMRPLRLHWLSRRASMLPWGSPRADSEAGVSGKKEQ